MINRTETVENELLFLGMNGLELKRGKQTKQNNFKVLFPHPCKSLLYNMAKKAFVSGEIPRPNALVTHLKKNVRR